MATVTTIATNMNYVYYLIASPTYLYGLVGGSLPIHIAQYNLDGTTHNASWYTFPDNTIFQKGTIIGSYMYLISNTYTYIVQIHINTDGTLGSVNNTWALIPNSDKGSDITSHNSTLYFSTSFELDRSIYSIVVTNGVIGNITPFIIGSIGPMLISDTNIYLRTNHINKYDLSGTLVKDDFFTPYYMLGFNVNNLLLYGNCIYMAYVDVYQSNGTIVQYDLSSGLVTNTHYISNSIPTFQMVALNSNIYLINLANNQMLTVSLPSINTIVPPIISWSSIDICFNATISSAPIEGVIFHGYYGFNSNGIVQYFYDSSDYDTNLIADDIVTRNLKNVLGNNSTPMNFAGANYINNVYLYNIPYVSAIFKSNPYIILSQTALLLCDNYGQTDISYVLQTNGATAIVGPNGNVYAGGASYNFGANGISCHCNPVDTLPAKSIPMIIDYTLFGAIKYVEFNINQGSNVILNSYFIFLVIDIWVYPFILACYTPKGTSNILLGGDGNCYTTHSFGQAGGLRLTSIPTLDSSYPGLNVYVINSTGPLFDIQVRSSVFTGIPSYKGIQLTRDNASFTMTNIDRPIIYNICFPKGTMVLTDQGEVEIDKIDTKYHTIHQKQIVHITQTQATDNYLVSIEKDAFAENVPSRYTEITGNHLVFYGQMKKAKTLINGTTIKKVNYYGMPLYNVLMEQYSVMSINNIICETLNPDNQIAQLYYIMAKNPENIKDIKTFWNNGILSK